MLTSTTMTNAQTRTSISSAVNRLLGWNTAITPSQVRQQFKFTYDGRPLLLDIQAQSDGIVPAVKIYVGSKFKDPGTYTLATTSNSSTITLDDTFVIGDIVFFYYKKLFYNFKVNIWNCFAKHEMSLII